MTGTPRVPCDRSWTTEAFPARARMSAWNDVVATHMTELNVAADDPYRFSAHWRQFDLNAIELNFIAAGSQVVRRTPQMVDRGGESTFELVHMQRGAMIVREAGREDHIREGDFVLLRNTAPYEFECLGDNLALTAHVTETWLCSWLADPSRLRDLPCEARMAWGRPLASLLLAISDNGLDDLAVPRVVIADQIGSLLQLVCGHGATQPTRGREATLHRVRSMLRQRFTEPGLGPDLLAREAGISKRHLHGLFAAAGSTFGAELMELRLQRAAHLLCETAGRAYPVGDIAFGVGFSDSSHFARRFRLRFGCSPSQWQAGVRQR